MYKFQIGYKTVSSSTDSVRRFLVYHAEAGIFTWARHTNKHSRGELAGRLDKEGYIRICVDGKEDRAHRWAYIYMVGDIPDGYDIDHINRNRLDTRWDNLRLATRSENNFNRDYPKTINRQAKGSRQTEEQTNAQPSG